jgi:hypothetical protein
MLNHDQPKAWYGPAFLPQGRSDGPWLRALRFEANSTADAIRKAERAYAQVRPGTRVEIADDDAEMRDALMRFMTGKSAVLKICPLVGN